MLNVMFSLVLLNCFHSFEAGIADTNNEKYSYLRKLDMFPIELFGELNISRKYFSGILLGSPCQGEAFVFVWFHLPPQAPRCVAAAIPCHPPIYKTVSQIHSVFHILDTSINSKAASTFQKVWKNISRPSLVFFSSN